MDIGSAKPDLLERNKIPHYGIDLHTLDEPYDVENIHFMHKKGSTKFKRKAVKS